MRAMRVLLTGALLAGVTVPKASEAAGTDPAAQVEIVDSTFTPQEVSVKVGQYVTWHHFDGDLKHSVTADDMSFDSSPLCGQGPCMNRDDKFNWLFLRPGKYPYHCRIHATYGMKGVITVE